MSDINPPKFLLEYHKALVHLQGKSATQQGHKRFDVGSLEVLGYMEEVGRTGKM